MKREMQPRGIDVGGSRFSNEKPSIGDATDSEWDEVTEKVTVGVAGGGFEHGAGKEIVKTRERSQDEKDEREKAAREAHLKKQEEKFQGEAAAKLAIEKRLKKQADQRTLGVSEAIARLESGEDLDELEDEMMKLKKMSADVIESESGEGQMAQENLKEAVDNLNQAEGALEEIARRKTGSLEIKKEAA